MSKVYKYVEEEWWTFKKIIFEHSMILYVFNIKYKIIYLFAMKVPSFRPIDIHYL